jgi:coproporphyrinogen III oxidase-like Fe-S oxidoreductase
VPEQLSPEEIGVLAAFTSLIMKSKGPITEADYKNIFKERKGLADKLEEKGYLVSKNNLVDLTPQGMAFVNPIADKIQEYVEEFINL